MRYCMILLSVIGLLFPCTIGFAKDEVWSNIRIEPTRNKGSILISAEFHRRNTSDKQLIVTALKLARYKSARVLEPIELIELGETTHLTAWFVIQKKERELWLGAQLDTGVSTASISMKIPGVLRETESTHTSYELVVDIQDTAVKDFTRGSPQFLYAPSKELLVSVPSWLSVKKHEGWTRLAGDKTPTYKLAGGWKEPGARILEFERSNFLAVWLDQGLPKFFVGVLVSIFIVSVAVRLAGGMKPLIRFGIFITVFIIIIILLAVGDWQAFNWRNMLISCPVVVGFTVVLFIIGFLPQKGILKLGDIYKQLKG